MSIIDSQIRTVSCNGCDKSVTYDAQSKESLAKAIEDNPWLKTLRIVQTAQGRNFAYHDDQCELSGVAAGNHNPEEPKKVITMPANASAIAEAAKAAKATEEATKAIKDGSGVTLGR